MLQQVGIIARTLVLLLAIIAPGARPAAAIDLDCPTATPAAQGTPASQILEAVSFPDEDVQITVFAAASLTDALAEIADEIETRHPNVSVSFETAGSQTLVTQISEGAEADVLATASLATMEDAQKAGLIDGNPTLFASNRLVIVTPPDNPAEIDGIEGIAGDNVRLVIAGEDVPAGRYARQAICAWAGDDIDVLAAIGDNVVSEEIDVRSTLAKVQLGEADAGIVYASDAATTGLAGGEIHIVEFPSGVPTTATYPIAPISDGNTEAAQAFIGFMLSDEGQQILADYGFTQVP